MNYLLAQSRDYYLDVIPPESVDGLVAQLKFIGSLADTPRLEIAEIKRSIKEQEKFTVQQLANIK